MPRWNSKGRPNEGVSIILGSRDSEVVVRPNYLVVYAETDETLVILRVLHAAQKWP